MNVEYAISNGEGTLIDYGQTDSLDAATTAWEELNNGHTIIIAPADDDCETGE